MIKEGELVYYQIHSTLIPIIDKIDLNTQIPSIALYTYKQWQEEPLLPHLLEDLPKGYESIHFCKLDSNSNYLAGTLCIPTKHNFKIKKRIIFLLNKNIIIFIDDSGYIENLLIELTHKNWMTPSIENFFLSFLEHLIMNDLLYIEELENRLSKLESAAINGEVAHFNYKTMNFRKELLTFHYYYSQLIDLTEVLIKNECHFFDEEQLNKFDPFIRRVGRMQDLIVMLRDYATQVREEYQAHIDIRQNNTMRILTVVTSIFLPLTLIVGWYGMNFT